MYRSLTRHFNTEGGSILIRYVPSFHLPWGFTLFPTGGADENDGVGERAPYVYRAIEPRCCLGREWGKVPSYVIVLKICAPVASWTHVEIFPTSAVLAVRPQGGRS